MTRQFFTIPFQGQNTIRNFMKMFTRTSLLAAITCSLYHSTQVHAVAINCPDPHTLQFETPHQAASKISGTSTAEGENLKFTNANPVNVGHYANTPLNHFEVVGAHGNNSTLSCSYDLPIGNGVHAFWLSYNGSGRYKNCVHAGVDHFTCDIEKEQ